MKTNWQDPGSGEILSTYISGLQEAVGKIEDTLQPSVTNVTNVTLEEIPIYEGDRYRIYQSPGKRNWVASPAPVIKVNEVVKDSGYTIEYGGGGVVFSPPLSAGDVVTADFSYVAGGSNVLDNLEDSLCLLIETSVTSVAGKTGNVVLSKNDVGLSNVDNVKQATQTDFDTHLSDNVSHRTQAEKEKLAGIESGARKLANVDDVKQMPLAGGTFTGTAKAHTNTGYTTAQIRNVILSTADADVNDMQNGEIWIKYGDA